MDSFVVTYPLDKLLGQNVDKSLVSTLRIAMIPLLLWMLLVVTLVILLPKVWLAITLLVNSGIFSLTFEQRYWGPVAYRVFLIVAAIALIIACVYSAWEFTKIAIRQSKINTSPTAKDFGIAEGLHYGDGQIEISDDGIHLIREYYEGHLKWDAVSSFIKEGCLIGYITIGETRVNIGYVQDEQEANQFFELATKAYMKVARK